jgi:Protein of unknown function (DUF2924)
MMVRHKDASREALSRLHLLDRQELRQEWRRLNKADASPHLSRELLVRAVAYRLQERAFGGLRPEPLRQLRQIATEVKQTGVAKTRRRPQLRSGTRLIREWQGRHYEVVVLDDGFAARANRADREWLRALPETAPWLVEYLHEMTVFPKGKHDDQVDSTAQFLDWFKTPMPSSGIYEFYRQKAEALAAAERGEQPKPVVSQLPDLMEVYRKAREHFDRLRYTT